MLSLIPLLIFTAYLQLQIQQEESMEESALPNIREVYRSTRENRDFNVIRKYEGTHKSPQTNCKPTKKDHYLDQQIRLNCSPGPSNTANHQRLWAKKPLLQPKRGEKSTYLNDITKVEKKLNFPSPNHYDVGMTWPKHKEQVKNISQKTNFMDTCQYEADKTPGPGSYNMRTKLSKGVIDKKWCPHSPIKPRQVFAAEVGTYSPCPQEYNTFMGYKLKKNASHPTLPKSSSQMHGKSAKENQFPGPGTYSTINCWPGKQPLKKDELNYMKFISKGPVAHIYH